SASMMPTTSSCRARGRARATAGTWRLAPTSTRRSIARPTARHVWSGPAQIVADTSLGDALTVVPEPEVKDALVERGVRVPNRAAPSDAGRLRAPLVVKAFGPGIVHKAHVGAVRLGVMHEEVDDVIASMAEDLESHGRTAAGFFVEEQRVGAGVELLFGVVRGPFGPMAMLAVGGSIAEADDLAVTRLSPLTQDDAHAMLDAFPAPHLLDHIDRGSLVDTMLAIDGCATGVGERLAEMECNPIVVDANGTIALDARLILLAEPAPRREPASTDFTPLFAPTSIAVAGASTEKQTFGNRFLAAYRDFGWTDGLYALHPRATEIDGVPAFASVADVPGGAVDYVLVAVPATKCAEVVQPFAGRV